MRKIYFLSTILFAFISFGYSQTTIIENNFDSYSNGDKMAQTAGSPWTTWSNAPGGSEDGTISNSQSVSPSNSLHIVTDNDQILHLSDLTTGRYRFDFDMRIESGKFGYFNLLQDFNGNSSKWGVQVKLNSDLSGSVDAGGESSATFTYTADTWMHVRLFVDLDSDLGTLLLDGDELVSWVWSGGAFGGNSLLKLDAVNFFGWDGTKGTAGYFIDNFVFASLPTLDAVTGLTAVLDAGSTGIDLTWDTPTNAPDYYGLIRNGKAYETNISGTSFNDANLYPDTYSYKVGAFYSDFGYTPLSAESTPVTIAGGTTRELVVFEIGTGTNCGYCPGASMGAHDLLTNGKNVAIVKYQNYSPADPYYTTVGTNRTGAGFYNFTGYPTTMTDGVIRLVGGSATESLYPSYLNYYDERISKPALYTLAMTITDNGSNNYTAHVTVNEISDYLSNPVRLVAALTESHIQYNWGNQTEVNNRCIGLYPDEVGTALNFTSGTTSFDLNFSVAVDASLTIDDYEFIIFVQEDNTKEIIQAAKMNMGDATIGVENISENISVYPNPARTFVSVNARNNSIVNIFDISGKLVLSETLKSKNQKINIKNFNSGIYIIEIKSENKIYNTKLIVK